MNFLDSIKRQEEEKHRISAWSRAVTELSRFIRRHLRQAEAQSPLTVRPDLIRLDGIFFVRLTVLFDGRAVTMTPLSLADARTPFRGGCVAVRSTDGTRCDLLWNGAAPAAPDNWMITGARDGSDASENGAAQPLCEESLDDGLNRLFELSGGNDRRVEAPRSAVTVAFAATPALYSGAINTNGRAPNLPAAEKIRSFAPSYRKP